ncbi:MAG: MBL fold hydrolase [Verrucomicrobia bacterium]|nr:MBL fold hydrolase [Verrucomicrobiota bacterium]
MSKPAQASMYVTFWGTRGSISTPGGRTEKYGGNTPCVSVRYKNTLIILDAGTGIRNLGLELAQQAQRTNTPLHIHLLLSHTHWDHIQGLPFFAPAYLQNSKISIYGSPNKEIFLESILQRQMDVNYFPVDMAALAAELTIIEISGNKIDIGPITVDWQEQVYHPGGSVRYRLSVGDRSIIYATDIELDQIFHPDKSNAKIRKIQKEYCSFIRGADLLIADGQYTAREYPAMKGWGHTSISTITDIAAEQRVKQLAVFHHDPQHSDTMLDKLWADYAQKHNTKEAETKVFWAREGLTLAI